MYYVNRDQIDQRLAVLPELTEVLSEAAGTGSENLTFRYAVQRALHLAIEVVTDVGSCLIDGFIMRDASSYEDIVDIIHGEQVIDNELHAVLLNLVRLRKPLVQEYFNELPDIFGIARELPGELSRFAVQVERFIQQELAR